MYNTNIVEITDNLVHIGAKISWKINIRNHGSHCDRLKYHTTHTDSKQAKLQITSLAH